MKSNLMKCLGVAGTLAALSAMSPAVAGPVVKLTLLGSYETGVTGQGASEISAYDPASNRLFVVNGASKEVDILDISNPANPKKVGAIKIASDIVGAAAANSVAVKDGLVAVAIENVDKQANGFVGFYNTAGVLQKSVSVGALPDMLTFSPDGKKVLVANEGEPNGTYTVDPEGSVSIIDLSGGVAAASVSTAGFGAFIGQEAALRAKGVRIFGPGANAAQDFEPEYIAFSGDGKTAFVSLQENNALAVIDVATANVKDVIPLGFKDYSKPGNGLDASDKDGAVNIRTYDNLFGMYQPDGIATYTVGGKTLIVTANEGDARDYAGFSEEKRAGSRTLDPAVFTEVGIKNDDKLGRLRVTDQLGKLEDDGDSQFEKLFAFGARSFSIFDENGTLIFDSGDMMEQVIAELFPDAFNFDTGGDFKKDGRSDDKGPEPEGVDIASLFGRIYAFIGLERMGGVMIFDITDPLAVTFNGYTNLTDFTAGSAALAGHVGPEGVLHIAASDSPIRRSLLVVSNEVSGSTDIYSVRVVPEPGTLGLVLLGSLGVAWAGRQRSRR